MNIIKKIVPSPIKDLIKLVIDVTEWVLLYRKVPIVLKTKHGTKFLHYPWNRTYMQIAKSGHDNEKEFTALSKLLNTDDTVFDIGANVGMVSVYVAKIIGHNGTVYAFEPVSSTYQMLQETITLNQCKNIQAYQIGLSNNVGKSEIYKFEGEHHTSNSLGNVNIDGHTPQTTEIINLETVDTFCKSHTIEHIDLLKIDVEGFEDTVLEGATTTLASGKITYIQFEISERPLASLGKQSTAIFDMLKKHKYNTYRFDSDTNKFTGPITKPDKDYDNYYATRADLTRI